MSGELEPVVGQWYWHHDKGQSFVVVAVEDDGGVELQHYDGDLEAMDIDAWREMEIELSEPPEDPTGPLDDVETDDLGYSDTAMESESWAEAGRDYRLRPEAWTNDPESRDGDEDGGDERDEEE